MGRREWEGEESEGERGGWRWEGESGKRKRVKERVGRGGDGKESGEGGDGKERAGRGGE